MAGAAAIPHSCGLALAWGIVSDGVRAPQRNLTCDAAAGKVTPNRSDITVVVLDGLEQREILLTGGRNAVVIFVPQNHNRVLSLMPGRRILDSGDQLPERHIAHLHQSWIQTLPGFAVVRIEVAEGGSVAAAVLIITLIRRDKEKFSTEPD